MANRLTSLQISEVSLCDRPANSEGGIPRARIALFKRDSSGEADAETSAVCGVGKAADGKLQQDGKQYPKSDFAFTPDDTPTNWKLRLTSEPGGKPDAHIVGAAVAALGPKGFRGNKVEIPAEALPGVKAKVRAAWKAANPAKGNDELPEVLKKGETNMPMTLEQIEKKLNDQDGLIATMKSENDALKAENASVLKMSKKERKLYASMSDDERKNFMAGDAEKKKGMLSNASSKLKEKAAEDAMEGACRKRYDAAGPVEKAAMLKDQMALLAKAKKKDGKDDEDDDEEMDEEMEKRERALRSDIAKSADRLTKAETELASIRKAQRISSFAKRAEAELPHTPGTDVEKGEMLMTLADSLGEDSTAFAGVLKSLKAADAALKLAGGEIGKVGGGDVPALQAFDAEVDKVAKADNITKAKAVEKVMMTQPELYLDYEKQQRHVASIA